METSIRREAARRNFSIFTYRYIAINTSMDIAMLPYIRSFFMKKAQLFKLYLFMHYIDFYERVKSLVKAKKTTIEHVVGEAGLSLASYNAYRRHKNLPRADEALKIAQVLDTSVEYLIIGEHMEQSASGKALTDIQDILNKYFNKSGEHGTPKK